MNALILAAGLGTRLKPLTDTMPKAMLPVAGKPLIAHQIERLKKSGFNHLVVNVHHFASQIVDFIQDNDFDIDITISDESDMLLDTGGAIKKAALLFKDKQPFLVHNVDIFHNIDLYKVFTQYASLADATLIVSRRVTTRYLLFDQDSHLVGWMNLNTGEVKSPFEEVRNNPAAYNRYAFSGMHIFSHALLKTMDDWPDKFSIIDFYLSACATHQISGLVIEDLRLLDVGKLDTITEAESFINH